MATVAETVTKLDDALSHQPSVKPGDNRQLAELIISNRVKVSRIYGEIVAAIDSDAEVKGNARLHAEFSDHLRELRHLLARHQVKWPMDRVAAEPDEYLKEAMPFSLKNREFLRWARTQLQPA